MFFRCRNWTGGLALALLVGCATTPPSPPPALPPPAPAFPPEARVTQRGVLTVHGRQFTLNGYVATSAAHGLRLVLLENFGGLLADVLVKRDGQVFVLQAKPPFRPAWVEHHIAADLKCIFRPAPETHCPVRLASPDHFIIERRGYKLELHTVEVKPGVQPAELFDETRGGKP